MIINSLYNEDKSYELIEDTRASNVAAMTGTCSRLTSIQNGTRILFHLAYATAASTTLNLTLAGGTTTGAKKVYRKDGTQVAANIGSAGCILPLTYLIALDGGAGGWMMDNAYDSNTNTIGYQIRSNSSTLPAADKGYRYRIWLTSADGSKFVPINTSTSTNSTTARSLNTRKIDPFGQIIYYSTNGTTDAGANLATTTMWQQITLTIGYSYVKTLSYPAPVYLKCTPQTDGSAVMGDIVQALPSTNDGKIYIFLGIAYSATAMELRPVHPVYYHDGTALRIWTGAASSYTLPTASAGTLGGVKVGSGLSIDGSGVLSASGGGGGSTWTDITSEFTYTGDFFEAFSDGKLVYIDYADVSDFSVTSMFSDYMPLGEPTGAAYALGNFESETLYFGGGASMFIPNNDSSYTGSLIYLCVGATE